MINKIILSFRKSRLLSFFFKIEALLDDRRSMFEEVSVSAGKSLSQFWRKTLSV